jgi:hypothetical protein
VTREWNCVALSYKAICPGSSACKKNQKSTRELSLSLSPLFSLSTTHQRVNIAVVVFDLKRPRLIEIMVDVKNRGDDVRVRPINVVEES